jgi:hypothetical protein
MPSSTSVRAAGFSRVHLMAMVTLAGIVATLGSTLLRLSGH